MRLAGLAVLPPSEAARAALMRDNPLIFLRFVRAARPLQTNLKPLDKTLAGLSPGAAGSAVPRAQGRHDG